jgi:cysteine desulfurase / selenocysteine lyase
MAKLVYFDNGATTFPKPDEVYDFMFNFYRTHGVNPGRSGYDLSIETEDLVTGTRRMMCEFFGGDEPERLIFAYNATDALNLFINGSVSDGAHVITTTLEHNSVLRPLYHHEIAKKINVTYIPFDNDGFIDPDDIKKAINDKTKFVIVNHGSNVIGTLQSVADIGRICKEKGVTFAIDASQTAGVIDINMVKMNIDVVAFTGHKSLLGPTGIGGLCVGKDVVINHTKYGGTGVKSAIRTHLDEYPFRLEAGTLNLIGVAGLNAGLKFIQNKTLDSIYKHEISLHNRLVEGLRKIDRVKVYCKNIERNLMPVVSFNIIGIPPSDVGILLDVDFNVACRTGLHCAPLVHEGIGTAPFGAVRFSLGYFNTQEQVDYVIGAIQEISKMKMRAN